MFLCVKHEYFTKEISFHLNADNRMRITVLILNAKGSINYLLYKKSISFINNIDSSFYHIIIGIKSNSSVNNIK